MTPPDLSDEQIERHRECLTIYYSSCCDCGTEQAELEALASANALCDMALRVRGLEQERDAYKMLCESDRSLAGLIPLMKWGLDQSNEAGFLRVALSEAESRAEASAKDAARYAFLKSRIEVPGAIHKFLAYNGWHPDTDMRNIDAAIDAAKEQPHG